MAQLSRRTFITPRPTRWMDGRTLTGLFKDTTLEIREAAFASINAKGKSRFEMRSLIGKRYSYIYNHFADGKNQFYDGKYPGGRSLKAMERAAKTNPKIRERLHFMYYRTKEELYDLERDPHALTNLADSPIIQDDLAALATDDRHATEKWRPIQGRL